jgi:hypothetical protein
MKFFYRISDIGYNKIKPDYINNENCLKNFCTHFDSSNTLIIADNIGDNTYDMVCKYIEPAHITKVSIGHGAGTFNFALSEALKLSDTEYVYFIENDYLHKPNSLKILQEGLNLGMSYVTLYDHPDKYLEPSLGGNPFCLGGAENTRVYLSRSCHWKITNSTTMTFAAMVKTLRKDENVLRKWTKNSHPNDFQMFLELNKNKRFVISSIPGYATHGETQYLTPLTEWKNYV